jgi:hypothetical protein
MVVGVGQCSHAGNGVLFPVPQADAWQSTAGSGLADAGQRWLAGARVGGVRGATTQSQAGEEEPPPIRSAARAGVFPSAAAQPPSHPFPGVSQIGEQVPAIRHLLDG